MRPVRCEFRLRSRRDPATEEGRSAGDGPELIISDAAAEAAPLPIHVLPRLTLDVHGPVVVGVLHRVDRLLGLLGRLGGGEGLLELLGRLEVGDGLRVDRHAERGETRELLRRESRLDLGVG